METYYGSVCFNFFKNNSSDSVILSQVAGAAEPHVPHVRRHRASKFLENFRASKF
jgi:hypothetical protein